MKILSIAIPSYNVENTILETVNSISKCAHLDKMEMIIVDDGSIDGTGEIIDDFKKKLPNIVKAIHKENGGHGSAINAAVEVAEGKYFIVVDGDDWVVTEELDLFVDFLERVNEDVVITGHTKYFTNINKKKEYGYSEAEFMTVEISYLNERRYRIPMTDICFSTELLRKVNIKLLEKTFYEDQEYCTVPFIRARSIIFSNRSFYVYRIGDVNQSISTKNRIKRVNHMINVVYEISKIKKQYNGIIKDENELYINRVLVGMVKSIYVVLLVENSEKKMGRKRAFEFFLKLKRENQMVWNNSKGAFILLYLSNFFPFNKKVWKIYFGNSD